MDEQRLKSCLERLQGIPWLSHAGEPCSDARVTHCIQSAWDDESERMVEVWRPRTPALEAAARAELGDEGIDRVFAAVSQAIQEPLYTGVCAYLDRIYGHGDQGQDEQCSIDGGLRAEMMDSMKRDACWACVERLINRPGFFTDILRWYDNGRWPCSWEGEYPAGRPVVL